ncbi:MAG: tRNA lysidine(34) synthetase TilS [Pelosinus sp.]|nr:tRNA lysidine(34) synthetase TilS [Pelosinus sp.]
MIKKVKAWIDKHKLIPPGSTVLAACSGGPDSLALVHILSQLQQEYKFTLAVGHVDHMFRGVESAEDARFVADFCRQLKLSCYQTAIDVPHYSKESGLSAEEAAREVRYGYLRSVAKKLGGALIATGHHRDDQAETVLMHLLRGSGSEGLGGMKARNSDIIRPFLVVSRSEIEEYCAKNKWQPRLDSTNLATEYLRNDLRLKLLPLLKREYNQAISEALCRSAEIIGAEHALIRELAESSFRQFVLEESGQLVIETAALSRLHIALQRELFRQIIQKKLGHLKGITFAHVEKLIKLSLSGETGSIIELPGRCIVRKEYGRVFVAIAGRKIARAIQPPGVTLIVPGITRLPNGSFVKAVLSDVRPESSDAKTAVFDWAALAKPIIVRTRLAGDRFQPLGLAGTKKIKDFFIDAKVTREVRAETLIFADAQEIIWLGGFRQAEHGKTTNATQHFLQITILQEEN